MARIVLTSAFGNVALKLRERGIVPEKARVAFIPTAGEVYQQTPWITTDRNALIRLGCEVFDVALQGQSADTLRAALAPADIIFVAGGNTTYLAARAMASGFDLILPDLLQERTYIGSSAGSILVGPSIEPFFEEDMQEIPYDIQIDDPRTLGLVDYIVLPHYPTYGRQNDKIEKEYQDDYAFRKLTDDDYIIEDLV